MTSACLPLSNGKPEYTTIFPVKSLMISTLFSILLCQSELLPNLVVLLFEKTTRKLSKIIGFKILNFEIEYELLQWVRFICAIKPKYVTIHKCLSKEFENSKNLSLIKLKTLLIQILKSKFEKSLNPNPIVKTKHKPKNSKPRTKYQT